MVAKVTRRQGGAKRRGAQAGRRMTDINVTSFVDVALVLLIVFMITAPMLTVGVPIELPRTAAGALPAERQEPLSVTLTADGRVMIQEDEVAADQLVSRLRAVAVERQDDRIYLRADGAIPYERVMQVMGALNSGGFRSIGLVTDSGGPALGTEAER